jgi:AcrR family transcriptional regulator
VRQKHAGLTVCFAGGTLGTVSTPGLASRSQQERSRTTQLRLLDATVSCLISHGWSGTTTTLIAETAGVSRGAQLHHFPTKTSLVLAAVEHLTERRAREIRAEAETLPADARHRVEAVIEMLAASFAGPLFQAALEVWVAARTDDSLREALGPLEAKIGRELFHLTAQLLGVDETRHDVRNAIQATIELLRGLGVANLLNDDSVRRRAVLRSWTGYLIKTIPLHDERSHRA